MIDYVTYTALKNSIEILVNRALVDIRKIETKFEPSIIVQDSSYIIIHAFPLHSATVIVRFHVLYSYLGYFSQWKSGILNYPDPNFYKSIYDIIMLSITKYRTQLDITYHDDY